MQKSRLAILLETGLLASRWILAPFYIGLVVALIALLGVFVVEVPREIIHLRATAPERLAERAIMMTLSLIDLSLAGNLLVIVILSGYENFVSQIQARPNSERPVWMGTVDFSGLKMKLISSIVAISVIALLRTYLELDESLPPPPMLKWQVLITVAFVISGVLLAILDWIVERTPRH
jgi:uncharacterized protein (TIGR00645 family)